jgi:hypothetical protein
MVAKENANFMQMLAAWLDDYVGHSMLLLKAAYE